MSTHNICFHAEIRKIIIGTPSYVELCFILHNNMYTLSPLKRYDNWFISAHQYCCPKFYI